MADFNRMLRKATNSSWHLWLLNQALFYKIPFNKPHGFKIYKIEDNRMTVSIPYKRKNFNHIKGIHACALATAGEFVSGLSVLRFINPAEYRMILQSIHVNYLYQAKMDAYASIELRKDFVEQNIIKPLQSQDSVAVELVSEIFDSQNNKLCDCTTVWQVKPWSKIKTKL
jgi:acyl-coenzyme A thioesterase PaaI-like protein